MFKNQADGALYVEYVDGVPTYYNTEEDAPEGAVAIADAIKSKATDLGLITEKLDEEGNPVLDDEGNPVYDTTVYDEYVTAFSAYQSYGGDDKLSDYLDEDGRTTAQDTIDSNNTTIAGYNTQIAENNAYISENSYWDIKDYSSYYDEGNVDIDPDKIATLAQTVTDKITFATEVLKSGLSADAGATRVTAQDAVIILNEAEYTSSSSNFSINGLNINALALTGDETITINTTQDNQGIYDKVKDFLSSYNEIINEMQSLYNADSAKGYEPLSDDEKEEMSDKEIEKWDAKIKDAILRRDSSLGTLISKMTSAMSNPITINGRGYSLSDFGIQTLGYMNAAKNEQYAYHIYGDQDDSTVSGREDKLMAMINQDPDTVIEYMQDLASNLYNAVGSEMKSTNLRTAYTVYNDKEMDSQYKTYTKTIKEWETKIADMEDRYYKKFSKMESTLAKLQQSTSSLTSLFGTN